MSGFAGIFHLDGAPVDSAWLENMADCLSARGPDDRSVWISGSSGLCHTLLRVSAETDGHAQIATLDGNVWITGDVRIDNRPNLLIQLGGDDLGDLRAASSTELILYAYAKWGDACTERLIGDFSFLIWDSQRRRVFAARDQMGIRLFYYAYVNQCLIVSNALDCILQVPIVSRKLNEQAIGDFLLIGENKSPLTTFYDDIHRLPVAHHLIADKYGVRTQRYWTLPIDEPIFYKHEADYVERFRELLCVAVKDRLPDGPLGVFMSGGLDSSAVAAFAVRLGASVTAYTSVYDRLIPDEERHYSGIAAQHIGIPIHYNVKDDESVGWQDGELPTRTSEPLNDPLSLRANVLYRRQLATYGRVFFDGAGPDAALVHEWRPYVAYLMRHRMWGRLCSGVTLHMLKHHRVPLVPSIPKMWRARREKRTSDIYYESSMPAWIDPEFSARLRLTERWEQIRQDVHPSHPIRPIGYSCFASDFPMGGTERGDSFAGSVATDDLHPLYDLRLVRFLLAVPVLPWCREKYLVRAAMRGFLPEVVRTRPKTPLAGLPYLIQARRLRQPDLPESWEFRCYVDTTSLPAWPGRNREELDYSMRALGLHLWLLTR